MNKFMNMSLIRKLGVEFDAVTLILTGVVLINNSQVKNISEISVRVTNLWVPAALASVQMQNGINHTLAAPSGCMLPGNEKFKDERAQAWPKEI